MLSTLIANSWSVRLKPEFGQGYFIQLLKQIEEDKTAGYSIYPAENNVFQALNFCAFEKVKVVILGQDPYHGPGQAHGLAFSVPDAVSIPPSLRNIFKEVQADVGAPIPVSGNLSRWSEQGVLLLNCILSVRANEAASHRNLGWENFTDQIIRILSAEKSGLVFLLWGKFAHKKAALIDQGKHLVLKAAHPSPLSAYNGFFGCNHFSKTNTYLVQHGQKRIDW